MFSFILLMSLRQRRVILRGSVIVWSIGFIMSGFLIIKGVNNHTVRLVVGGLNMGFGILVLCDKRLRN